LALEAKTQQFLNDPETHGRMVRLADWLSDADIWNPGVTEAQLKDFVAQEGVGFGKIGPVLRGILSGGSVAPDLASALTALGCSESVGRLHDALSKGEKDL